MDLEPKGGVSVEAPTKNSKKTKKMIFKNQERIKILLDQLKDVIQVIESTLTAEAAEEL